MELKPKIKIIKLLKSGSDWRLYLCEGSFGLIGFKGQDIVLLADRAEQELTW